LRTLGADTSAADALGRLPVSYCQDGSSAAAIRAELVDPALDFLMRAARQSDEASCNTLGYAGMLGYLSVRQCVDVHAGDCWTPLMEAIVCGNMVFAGALARGGADIHRGDARGMSAMFWAHALFGRDVAESLAAQQLETQPMPAQSKVVSCKDGELQVSAEAFVWMESNFPIVAAGAVPCATLADALRSQGLDVIGNHALSLQGQSESVPCALLNESESAALERLGVAAQKSIGDALILEVSFDGPRQSRDEAGGHCDKSQAQLSTQARMANGSGPRQVNEVCSDLSLASVHRQYVACEIVDFLRKLPENHQIPGKLLAQARLAAIRMVASGAQLRLQHAFLLHVFCADVTLLNFTNAALDRGDLTDVLESFISTLHDAMQELQLLEKDATVFRLVPGQFDPETYSKGNY